MKKAVGLIITAVFMFMQAGMLSAATTARSFTASATIPTATGIDISSSSVATSSGGWTPLPSMSTTMNFATMTYNSTFGFWGPDHYFAVDFGATGGSGEMTTVVTYTEGTNQNAAAGGHGLGYKATASFMKVVGSGNTTTETAIPALGVKRLIDLTSSTTVTQSMIAGGWLRVYLGIASGAAGEPAGTELFTNIDHGGQYTGEISFTATVS